MSGQPRTSSAPVAEPDDLLGGRYRVDQELASGSAGHLLAAWDAFLGRRVVVKVLDGLPDEVARVRALRALTAASRCRHPRLVRVYDVRREPPVFAVLEAVDGQPVNPDRVPLSAIPALLTDVLNALAALHDGGAVHRDVTTSNVLLGADGKARLTPAGITEAASDVGLGLRMGSEPELRRGPAPSPEQAEGLPADARSDVAAFAAFARSLLRPVDGTHVDVLLRRATADDPRARPQDATAMRLALDHALRADGGPEGARRSPAADTTSAPPGLGDAVVLSEDRRPPTAESSEPAHIRALGQVSLVVAAIVAAALLVVVPFFGGEDRGASQAAPLPPGAPRPAPSEELVATVMAAASTSEAELPPGGRAIVDRLSRMDDLEGVEREAEAADLYGSAAVLAQGDAPDARVAAAAADAVRPELTLNGLTVLVERRPERAGARGAEMAERLRNLEGLQGDRREAEAFSLGLDARQGMDDGQLTPEFVATVRAVLGD